MWERLSAICCLKVTHLRNSLTFDLMAATEHPNVSPSPTAEVTSPPTTLATTDIVVLVIYFLLVLAVGLWVSLLKRQNALLYHFTVTKCYSSICVTYHIYGLPSCIWHIYNLCSPNSPCGRQRGAQWMDIFLPEKPWLGGRWVKKWWCLQK